MLRYWEESGLNLRMCMANACQNPARIEYPQADRTRGESSYVGPAYVLEAARALLSADAAASRLALNIGSTGMVVVLGVYGKTVRIAAFLPPSRAGRADLCVSAAQVTCLHRFRCVGALQRPALGHTPGQPPVHAAPTAQSSPLFDPAKHLFDPAAGIDRLGVALMACGAAINGRTARSSGVLGNVRSHGDPSEAVSYTHLTLPTIYSV